MSDDQKFADYVLFEKLATTAFGTCFRAGRALGSVVDSHVLLQLFNGSSLDAASFWQLVSDRQSLLETLRDPHLAETLAFEQVGSIPYASWAYSPGKQLDDFFTAVRDQKMPVPVDQALFIIERAALGLTAAHEVVHRGRPVLHGFLVPELIRLSSEGEIRVLGIESAPGLRSQLASHPAFISYLAPEVQEGEAPAETDDVYSLGAILFHLLTGEPLLHDPDESVIDVIEDATLAADSEPIPAVIKNLLKNSLAPRADRIPDAVTWQQVLGKIILDGEHNPTTFNLSFLIHTVFRQDLEDELKRLPGELAYRLPSASAERDAKEEEREGIEETPSPPIPGLPAETSRWPFLTGFAASFLAAVVFVGAYFTFFHTVDEANAVSLPRLVGVNSPTAALPAPLSERQAAKSGVAAGEEISTAITEPGEDSVAVPAELSQDGLETQLQELLTSRTDDLESTLRAEYEARILDLEERLAANAAPAEPSMTQSLELPDDAEPATTEPLVLSEIAGGREAPQQLPADLSPSASADPSPAADPSAPGSGDVALGDGGSGVDAEISSSEALVVESSSETVAEQPTTTTDLATSADEPAAVVFEPPRLESSPRPRFPSAARRLRRSASVSVRVLVDPSGNVSTTELPGPVAGFGFDSAAEAAAKRSRWSPATRNGIPVESWAVLTIEFQP